jgi:hypothetical protein
LQQKSTRPVKPHRLKKRKLSIGYLSDLIDDGNVRLGGIKPTYLGDLPLNCLRSNAMAASTSISPLPSPHRAEITS